VVQLRVPSATARSGVVRLALVVQEANHTGLLDPTRLRQWTLELP
jgi:hypothetical protein